MRKISGRKKQGMSEADTIKSILVLAREQGVEDKVKGIILKYQDAVKGARTEFERKHIAAMGIAEIHNTIGCVGSLVVDGNEVLPEAPGYVEAINQHKSTIKID